ncbi:MAG: fumarylacetoacetate hydrolase family protein [Tolumonas sp.]|nr:fumarylacetoacetate hydrolase family protein [Tolumonas sp.]
MKLLSFIRADGSKSYGIYKDNGIVDLGLRLGDKYKDIKALLAADALSLVSQYAGEQIDYSADTVRFLPIIESPDKILCVGMNYMAKRQEFDETNNAPTLFVRFPESQTGHACGVVKPQVSNEFDYEGELAVIIGKSGKHIRREEALHYVAGYSCYMDGSVRDWQHSWFTAGKNWQETGAFGPWMVTTDEIANPHELDIRTYLNGQMVQNDNTGNMVHSIPELIEYISTFATLSAGDVIITGSPGGVGKKRTPPLFMKEGDVIEVEIQKIGKLRNQIVSDAWN